MTCARTHSPFVLRTLLLLSFTVLCTGSCSTQSIPQLSTENFLNSPRVIFTDPMCGPGYASSDPGQQLYAGFISAFRFHNQLWWNSGTELIAHPLDGNFDHTVRQRLPFFAFDSIVFENEVWFAGGPAGVWRATYTNGWQFSLASSDATLAITSTTDGAILAGTQSGLALMRQEGMFLRTIATQTSAYPVVRVRASAEVLGAAACGQFGLSQQTIPASLNGWRWHSSDELNLNRRAITDLFFWSDTGGIHLMLAAGGDGWWQSYVHNLDTIGSSSPASQVIPNLPGVLPARIRHLQPNVRNRDLYMLGLGEQQTWVAKYNPDTGLFAPPCSVARLQNIQTRAAIDGWVTGRDNEGGLILAALNGCTVQSFFAEHAPRFGGYGSSDRIRIGYGNGGTVLSIDPETLLQNALSRFTPDPVQSLFGVAVTEILWGSGEPADLLLAANSLTLMAALDQVTLATPGPDQFWEQILPVARAEHSEIHMLVQEYPLIYWNVIKVYGSAGSLTAETLKLVEFNAAEAPHLVQLGGGEVCTLTIGGDLVSTSGSRFTVREIHYGIIPELRAGVSEATAMYFGPFSNALHLINPTDRTDHILNSSVSEQWFNNDHLVATLVSTPRLPGGRWIVLNADSNWQETTLIVPDRPLVYWNAGNKLVSYGAAGTREIVP